MTSRHRLGGVAAVLALALAPTVVAAAPSRAAAIPVAQASCPYGYFCAFSGTNFTGGRVNLYYCSRYGLSFSGTGSWINNRTAGTRATFYLRNGRTSRTAPAPSSDASQDWRQVAAVQPC